MMLSIAAPHQIEDHQDPKPDVIPNDRLSTADHPNPFRYKNVYVLLVSWKDDDLGVWKEVNNLHEVFTWLYNFEVKSLQLPSSDPEKYLEDHLKKYQDIFSSTDYLFILYYAGHGYELIYDLIWCPGSGRVSDKSEIRKARVSWSKVPYKHLGRAACDVLLIFDCCNAAAAATAFTPYGTTRQKHNAALVPNPVVEMLAASASDANAFYPCRRSFSHALIKELVIFAGQGKSFPVSDLNIAITKRLEKSDQKFIIESKSVRPGFARLRGDKDAMSIWMRLPPLQNEVAERWHQGSNEGLAQKRLRRLLSALVRFSHVEKLAVRCRIDQLLVPFVPVIIRPPKGKDDEKEEC